MKTRWMIFLVIQMVAFYFLWNADKYDPAALIGGMLFGLPGSLLELLMNPSLGSPQAKALVISGLVLNLGCFFVLQLLFIRFRKASDTNRSKE
jgi:hypothetical protein